jgi:hypothetical protein
MIARHFFKEPLGFPKVVEDRAPDAVAVWPNTGVDEELEPKVLEAVDGGEAKPLKAAGWDGKPRGLEVLLCATEDALSFTLATAVARASLVPGIGPGEVI